MNFLVRDYIPVGEILNGIEDGTVLPKSDSLILSLILHTKKNEFRENVYRLFSNYTEFLPINLFTGCMTDSHSTLYNKILNYKSPNDGELSILFNKIVMILAYSEFYVNKSKWEIYFNGYDNKSISEEEKHKLLEFTINNVCDLIGMKHMSVVPYTYYVDGIMKDYFDSVPYNENLNKFYIEGVIGSNWTHDEEKARNIIFICVAKCLLSKAKNDIKLRQMLGVTESEIKDYVSNKTAYYKDVENIAKALGHYYKIYTADIKFQF